MERCLKLYEERRILSCRFANAALAFVVLCLAAFVCLEEWPDSSGNIGAVPAASVSGDFTDKEERILTDHAEESIATINREEADIAENQFLGENVRDVTANAAAAESMSASEEIKILPAVQTDPETAVVPAVPAGPETAVVPTVPAYPEMEAVPAVPEDPQMETVPVVPEISETIVPQEQNDPVSAETSDEETDGGISNICGGFYIDEAGMITGIADASVIMDGYLELPAQGCSGIRSGAFLLASEGIREIFIPGNINYIEEGAFAGAGQLEWIEKEASGGCYTEDGVLFSEDGACLLAVPAARTGSYKVPAHVTRFARDAFWGTQISVLDTIGAQIVDMGNIPDGIEIIRAENK